MDDFLQWLQSLGGGAAAPPPYPPAQNTYPWYNAPPPNPNTAPYQAPTGAGTSEPTFWDYLQQHQGETHPVNEFGQPVPPYNPGASNQGTLPLAPFVPVPNSSSQPPQIAPNGEPWPPPVPPQAELRRYPRQGRGY